MYRLSLGSCQRLHDTAPSDDPILTQPHILQILAIKVLNSTLSANSVDRYRIIISDGAHFMQAMLATGLSQYVQETQMQRFSVILIKKMTCHQVQDKHLFIVHSLRVIGLPDNKIGDPKPISPERTAWRVNSVLSSMTSSFDGLENKQKGEGKLSNVTLMDESRGIKTTDIISPCSCLNDDVLREIFIRCVPNHGYDSKCFILDNRKPSIRDYPQLCVSQVCSSWRHVALLTPQLWNNILIQCLTESNLTIARKYLSRARNLPISITLGPETVGQDWCSLLSDFLSSYQVRELVVSAKIPRFHAVLRDLPQRSVEDLEVLGMFYNHDPEEAAIDLNDIRYPKLASVAISSAYKISGCNNSLRVFDGTELLMTVIGSWDLLSRCPSLEEARLRLMQLMPDDGNLWQLPKSRIYHQSLRILTLESQSGNEIPFNTFISALALPSLETMHVLNARVAWSATAFQSLSQRSNNFPNLSDFLLSITTSDVDAGTLLSSMPYVTSVSLQCSPFNAVFDQWTLTQLASGSLAPRLQHLVGCISNGKEFLDMVESRITSAQMSSNGIPAPFTKVEVPFSSEDDIARLLDMRRRGIPIYRWFI